MRYRRLHTLGFAVLLATLTAIHCIPTATQADRRRSTTFLAASSQDSWPEWDGVTAHPELTDAHPTTGWPREYGRICVTFTSGASGEHRAIIDGRTDGEDPRPYLSVVNDGRIRFGIQTVGSIAGGEIIPFHTHTACVDRSYGPITSLYLDGQLIGTSTTLPAWDWHPTARLGSRYGGADPLGGEIKSIQWRGFRLACDMRSDTCSDGRKITTTRATPVPCEVAPGVWEMVGVDEGCYSVRGLEAWAPNTTYLAYGAELDRSPWRGLATATKVGANYLVCHETAGEFREQLAPEAGGVVRTAACRVRAGTSNSIRLLAANVASGGVNYDYTLTSEWQTVTATATIVADGGVAGVRIHPAIAGAGCIDVAGCWSVVGATPGRACWGGEAPVTCGADRHTLSTEGWPTESGEVCVTVTLGEDAPSPAVILDGRASSGDVGTVLYHYTDRLRWKTGSTELVAPALQRGQPSRVCAGRSGGRLYVRVNGAHHEGPEAPALSWEPTAYLGHGRVTSQVINGSISSLRVRSFE